VWYRGGIGIVELVQRWCRGGAGAEMQRCRSAEWVQRGSGFSRGGVEVVGAGAEQMQRCCRCRGAAEVVQMRIRGAEVLSCCMGEEVQVSAEVVPQRW